MKEAIKARCPSKIDIGPVYSCNPQDRLKFGGESPPIHLQRGLHTPLEYVLPRCLNLIT